MKVEFRVVIKEFIGKDSTTPNAWVLKEGTVTIEASKDAIDAIIKAIQTVPGVEVQ